MILNLTLQQQSGFTGSMSAGSGPSVIYICVRVIGCILIIQPNMPFNIKSMKINCLNCKQ